MWERQLFVHGADVDDLAASLCLHAVLHKRLGHEERTLQIHVENEIVVFFAHIPEIGAAFKAGVVDEDVEAAQLLHGVGDEAL